MSPKTVTILSPQKRREVIRENILNLEYDEIALLCHCTERTIKRDVQKWKKEGGFEEFLIDEFFTSYPDIKTRFPERAFDRLCYLLGKTMTRKIEAKSEYTEKVLHVMVSAKMMKDESANSKTGNRLRAT